MLPSIPGEGSYASWLANCLQKYFESLGFTFYHEIQTPPREHDYPFDIIARISKGNFVKRFGLQVKRPYPSRQGIYWLLDLAQHSQMKNFPWIWYSLPDFLNRNYYLVACFHTLFTDSNFPFVPTLYKSKIRFFLRLGTFANRVERCPIGEIVGKDFDWAKSEDIFREYQFINQIHTYLDFTERKAQLFTNIEPRENEREQHR